MIGVFNSCKFLSTSTLQSGSEISKNVLSAKSSTKNPVLNLSKPSESWTCKVFVLNSKILKEVKVSKFSTRSSIFPISLIVYLLLSTVDITASLGS